MSAGGGGGQAGVMPVAGLDDARSRLPGDSSRLPQVQSVGRHRVGLLIFLLTLALGFLVWSPGLNGPYQFDDYATPLNDPASQSLADWRHFLPQTLRPFTKLTYAIEADAGLVERPVLRRAVSIGLLALAAVLLYRLIAQLQSAASPLLAVGLAAVWLMHPVQADSVLLISGRTALLAALCLLAALLAFERARPWPAGALFLCACLSRETALAGLLPFVVLAASRPGVTLRAALRSLLPVCVAGLIALGWFLTTPRYLALAEYSFLGRPLWDSVFAQVGAVPVGLWLLLQPSQLSIDYGITLPTTATHPLFLTGLALYLLAAAGIVMFLRRARTTAFGLALWLAALLPTQSLVPKLDALSNRPLSLALAGLLIAIAPLLCCAVARLRGRMTHRRTAAWTATVFGAAALCMVGLLAHATLQRSGLFVSELALWQDAAGKSPANARPHLQVALLLKQAGRDREAWQAVTAAHAIDPFSADIDSLYKAWRPGEETP